MERSARQRANNGEGGFSGSIDAALVQATRDLSAALARAPTEQSLSDAAISQCTDLLNADGAQLWFLLDGEFRAARHPERKIAVDEVERCREVLAADVLCRGVRPAYLGAAIRWDQEALGVLTVERAEHPFVRREWSLLRALADVIASRLVHLRIAEQAAQHARTDRSQADEQLRAIYEAIACGVTVWSPEGALLQYNTPAEQLMGVSMAPLLGQPLLETVRVVRQDGSEAPLQERRVLTAAHTGKAIRNYTSTVTRSDGETRFLQMNAVPVFGPDGQVTQVVCSFVDFTDRKRAEEQLAHLALHDSLTGLPNRKLLLDRLQQAIERARRSSDKVALLLIDLDGFKQVNDTRGHHVGDDVLREVATRWGDTLRAGDTLARLGGDEFVVLLPASDALAAERVARNLLAALEPAYVLDGAPVWVGASIGTAIFPVDGAEAEDLLRCADAAMYREKQRSARSA